MDLADTIRVELAVQYRTSAWQTIEVDLGPAGAGNIDVVGPAVRGLAEKGLPIPSRFVVGGSDARISARHRNTADLATTSAEAAYAGANFFRTRLNLPH